LSTHSPQLHAKLTPASTHRHPLLLPLPLLLLLLPHPVLRRRRCRHSPLSTSLVGI
jgi:hypothetical protein